MAEIIKRQWTDEEYAEWLASLETRDTPRTTPQNLYEIKHTGDQNYRLTGGGEKFWADGLEAKTVVLEAKKIVTPARSPFIPTSQLEPELLEMIVAKVRDEFRRVAIILRDEENPLASVRVIVNDAQARSFFESLLHDYQLPGEVIVRS